MGRKRITEPTDFQYYRELPGVAGEIMRAALGQTSAHLDEESEIKLRVEQARRPNVFVRKYQPGRRKKQVG